MIAAEANDSEHANIVYLSSYQASPFFNQSQLEAQVRTPFFYPPKRHYIMRLSGIRYIRYLF